MIIKAGKQQISCVSARCHEDGNDDCIQGLIMTTVYVVPFSQK
jgi:hypothetical protein